MRLHKSVAQILFFLSIVNFTFADLAQTPKMLHKIRVDSVTGADASEGGHAHSGELPEWLGRPQTAGHSHSRFDIPGVQSFNSRDDPISVKFFNEHMSRKYKKYLLLGVIDGVLTGISNSMIDEIFGTVSPNAYVFTSPPHLRTLEWCELQTYSDYAISQ